MGSGTRIIVYTSAVIAATSYNKTSCAIRGRRGNPMPVKASPAEKERGQRLARWLARVRPDLPKTRRGPAVFGVSRETVANWIKGADINNDAIIRILETGGCRALAEILGIPLPPPGAPRYQSFTLAMKSDPIRADAAAKAAKTHIRKREVYAEIHGQDAMFWYLAFVHERIQAMDRDECRDYADWSAKARKAFERAEHWAKRRSDEISRGPE